MPATITQLTAQVDDAFTHTWFKMQKKATDNILDANVLSALLREAGSFKTQVGEDRVARTVRYGKKTAITVKKGDTLPTGEDAIDTMAWWTWRYIAAHVQRSLQDDQQNSGAGKIMTLVTTKLEAARDSLNDKWEDLLIANADTSESRTDNRSARDPYSVYNFLDESIATATHQQTTAGLFFYGNIDRGGVQTAGSETLNHWWQNRYTTAVNPMLANLFDQMGTTYNNASASGGSAESAPNLILTTQAMWEAFSDIAGANIQLTADVGSRVASLGYDLLKFRGAKVAWTRHSSMKTGQMLFMNSRWIDVVYDPNLWFQMMPWMNLPNQLERITRILMATPGVICYQPRRQAILGDYSA